jgi:hypothetical protein
MPYIQKLYDICKASMTTEGPKSEEALQKVRAVLGTILIDSMNYMNLFGNCLM